MKDFRSDTVTLPTPEMKQAINGQGTHANRINCINWRYQFIIPGRNSF